MTIDPQALRDAAKKSLISFAAALHVNYQPNWHHRVIARAMERLAAKEPGWDRLLISVPPRHGKSALTTVMFPPWYLGQHPHENVIVATYGSDLADDMGRQARAIAAQDVYEAIFETELDSQTQAITKWQLMNRGMYFSTSVGAAMTGKGANVLIIDDPHKNREDADSETARGKVWDWFLSTAFTRLEKNGSVVVIQTRWHEDDLIGRLQDSNMGWKTISFPAIAEEDEPLRKVGEALWPAKFDLQQLDLIKRQVGEREWASLFQQRPAPREGAIFKKEYWSWYDPSNFIQVTPWNQIFQSWDTGVSVKKDSARSCCTTWGLGPGGFIYLIDVWKGKLEFPDLKRKAIELARVWQPRTIWVEEQQTGGPLIAELKRNTEIPIKGVRLRGDKEVRAEAVSAIVESGKVKLPLGRPWVDDYVNELASFPAGKYADQVDSTTLALRMLGKMELDETIMSNMRARTSRAPVSIFGR